MVKPRLLSGKLGRGEWNAAAILLGTVLSIPALPSDVRGMTCPDLAPCAKGHRNLCAWLIMIHYKLVMFHVSKQNAS